MRGLGFSSSKFLFFAWWVGAEELVRVLMNSFFVKAKLIVQYGT
jgi:hypothetical protein